MSLTNSRFVGNTANSAGVLDVLSTDGQVTLNGDEFDDNKAASNGVGAVDQVKSLTATDSSFIGNQGGFGAVFQINSGTLAMTNVTMSQNSSPNFGGALLFGLPVPTSLTNVTIADNSAAPGGGGVFDTSNMTTGSGATGVLNTIIADNTGGDCADAGSRPRYPRRSMRATTSTATAAASRVTRRPTRSGSVRSCGRRRTTAARCSPMR